MEIKAEMLNEIVRPCIDNNGETMTKDGVKILECSLLDNGNIEGYTEDHKKALYVFDTDSWYFGRDIGKANLINLRERTEDERLRIIEKANESKRRNIEQKKNFNELAKAMLEQTVTEEQIKAVMGDSSEILLDSSVGSVILGAMIKGALNGSFKCAEFVRDTAGYKPKNEVELNADIMTDADKALIDKALKTG
jgi:transcriptional regulator NrdR family protein